MDKLPPINDCIIGTSLDNNCRSCSEIVKCSCKGDCQNCFCKRNYQMFLHGRLSNVSAREIVECFCKGDCQMFLQGRLSNVSAREIVKCFCKRDCQFFLQERLSNVSAREIVKCSCEDDCSNCKCSKANLYRSPLCKI